MAPLKTGYGYSRRSETYTVLATAYDQAERQLYAATASESQRQKLMDDMQALNRVARLVLEKDERRAFLGG